MADPKENIKRWVDTWEIASVAMDEIKRQELQAPDYYEKTMLALEGMFNYALENSPVKQTSGLLEMQKYFMLLARKNGQLI